MPAAKTKHTNQNTASGLVGQPVAFNFQGQSRFITSAADAAKIVDFDLPEVAFIGRSNCGKSSLLNAVMGSKNLARTSNTPGRTRLFNAFEVAGRLILLDLPGYGYAKVSQQQRQEWMNQWQGYLRTRLRLCHVFVLIDARRGFMAIDREMMSMLDAGGRSFTVVLTKADKLPEKVTVALQTDMTEILLQHPAATSQPIISSVKSRQGIDQLRHKVLDVCALGSKTEDHATTPAAISRMISTLRKTDA